MLLGSVTTAPAIDLDRALTVDAIAFLDIGRGLGGFAEHGHRQPLHGVVFADTDTQANPQFAGLRCPRLCIRRDKSEECAFDAHDALSIKRANTSARRASIPSSRVASNSRRHSLRGF